MSGYITAKDANVTNEPVFEVIAIESGRILSAKEKMGDKIVGE